MPPGDGRDRLEPTPVLGWRARLEALHRSIMRHPVMLTVTGVTRAYDRGGGGMLAGSLAYFAFFTMVPALLLFVGLLGVLVEDGKLRQQLIDGLVNQLDPIKDVASFLVSSLADTGRTGTIIGVLGLLWGASGFYGALQGAMQRMFPGPGSRDFFRTRFRGVLTVVLILGSMLTAVVIIIALPLVTEWLEGRCLVLSELQNPLIDELCNVDLGSVSGAVAVVGTIGVAFLIALLVYVAVPPDGPSPTQAFWPAVVAGIIIGLLTSLFAWIAPLLVRHWLTLGVVGSVFVALIWFNLVFQVLLYGAAFARIRRDRDRTRLGPPSI